MGYACSNEGGRGRPSSSLVSLVECLASDTPEGAKYSLDIDDGELFIRFFTLLGAIVATLRVSH